MSNINYRFKIGQFECLIISDGTILVPDSPSQNPPKRPGMQSGQNMDILCVFINTGDHKILIDTGCGNGFQPTTGKLTQNLIKEGINCREIDSIIFTHGHLDHVAGSFDSKGHPVFPKAHYFVSKKEWECWVNRPEKKQLQPMFSTARKNFLSIPEQFTLIADGEKILPGIQCMMAPGHSPGSIAVKVSSGTDQLLCIGDMIHSLIEFDQPDYYAFLDTDPQQAVRSRTETLSQAAKSNILVFACHFAFPGLGHIIQKDGTLSWKPIGR